MNLLIKLKTGFKKKAVLTVVVLFTLAACNGGGGTGETTPTPTQQEDIVLIWWNMFEPKENVQPLIDAYESAHPNVTIQYDEKGVNDGVDGYRSTLNTVLSDEDALSTPDIFIVHNSWVDKYKQFIRVASESDVARNNFSDFYPIVENDFSDSSGIYGLPLYLDTLSIIYNKNKLIESGYTVPSDDWSEFQTQAKNLTKRSANNQIVSAGFSANIVKNTEFYFDLINLLFLQNGVNMTDTTGEDAIFGTEPELTKAKDALTFYQDFLKGDKATWSDDLKIDIASFLEKKLAMFAAPSWRLINILDYNQKYNLGLDVGVVPMPQLGGDKTVAWPTYWAQTVAKDSANPTAAWDFINFITQAEQLQLLDSTVQQNGRPFGILFPRKSMESQIIDSVQFKDTLGPYVQQFSKLGDWPMVDGFAVRQVFDDEFDKGSDLTTIESRVDSIIQSKGDPP
ncbi:MAG: ABC transporter substrate-binding protein [Candidatus Dojkabacteria bacterium]